jgi:hypothetical protein
VERIIVATVVGLVLASPAMADDVQAFKACLVKKARDLGGSVNDDVTAIAVTVATSACPELRSRLSDPVQVAYPMASELRLAILDERAKPYWRRILGW